MKKGQNNQAGATDSLFKNAQWVFVACVVIITVSTMLIFMFRTSKIPVEIIIIGTSNSISSALWTIADEKGFSKEEGLEVIIKRYKSAGAAFEHMPAEKIAITVVSETPIMYKTFKGSDRPAV